ncbi:Cof-type HAD-IIB family hydrolase [Pseudoclavibacter sp. AY1F1]|uniref:Cof-type HAD-IIB family hydrolase n=1 Tax=Pseudoclavibacter sp. AY1F1 TaxID=2080583 RepID=UPI0015E465CF|nr:Cof-type HAD-IIB family hydrolase [Pseudoclavibacter sp. AY1F1]
MTRRIVFLDIDGTLIDDQEHIQASTVEAVVRARAAGHLLFICTGRSRAEIYPQILDIGFDGIVSAGGSFVWLDGETRVSRTMPVADAEFAINYFTRSGIDFYVQSDAAVVASDGFRAHLRRLLSAELAESNRVEADGELQFEKFFEQGGDVLRDDIGKMCFLSAETPIDDIRAAFSGRFDVINATVPVLGPHSGELLQRGVNKGSAILEVCRLKGLDQAATIGIGDSINDVEMLQVTGVGVAMGNAPDAIKAHADQVTTGVDDNGVWNAFVRNGLVAADASVVGSAAFA